MDPRQFEFDAAVVIQILHEKSENDPLLKLHLEAAMWRAAAQTERARSAERVEAGPSEALRPVPSVPIDSTTDVVDAEASAE